MCADLPPTRTHSLGALLELAHVLPIENSTNDWLHDDSFKAVLEAKANGVSCYQEGEAHLGFVRVGELIGDETIEIDFYIRARRAAEFAGFQKTEAAQFIAAIVELYGNVVEHSCAVPSAYVAFAAYDDCFEFIVADSGIGVLQSLRSSSQFSDLKDNGSALELALTEGISRHISEADRGRGFRPLFLGLANVSEYLRFRSGDHSRELRRLTDGSIPAVTSQKPELAGFFCFVRCKSKKGTRALPNSFS